MKKIPNFKTDREMAQFWDTHSLADFEAELRPVKDMVFVKPDRQVISLRLDRKVVKAIKSLAHRKGIGYSSLIRMWVIEDFMRETRQHNKAA
jgi:predicted DNA binding CopG/RHH family protein